jgi:hypothetical protein
MIFILVLRNMYTVFELNSIMYNCNTLCYVNDVCFHKFSCILSHLT